ncbi:MAG: DUF1670 domain-containing protein [Thermoplasmata archaeon]
MKKDNTPYTGMRRKNFESALEHLLNTEYGFLGGKKVMELIVDDVKTLVQKFYPKNLSIGQVVWPAIKAESNSHQFDKIEKHELVPVVLSLITREEVTRLSKGEKKIKIWEERGARLVNEAYDQGGVLTLADVGMFLSVAPNTACRYLKRYQEANDTILPIRGNIHDMGRGMTHKRTIIEKKLENKSTGQVARETSHSPKQVDRYFGDYRRVKMLLKRDLDRDEVIKATGMSESLVEEHAHIVEETEGEDL